MKKSLSLLLAAFMLFALAAGCNNEPQDTTTTTQGGTTTGSSGGTTTTQAQDARHIGPDGRVAAEKQEYRTLYSGEVSTMNYLTTGYTNDLVVGANTIDSLVENDQYGNILPGSAEEWDVSDDGLKWTFKIRQGQYWYDCDGNQMDPVTAHDYVAAIQYVCDAQYDASNFYLVDGWIVNATEYYDYTAAVLGGFKNADGDYLDGDPAEDTEDSKAQVVPAISADEIGVKALDDYTLEFTLCIPRPYFLTALQFGPYWPAPKTLLESLGELFAIDNTSMWFNGSYILSTFEPQNMRVYTKNANYWDADNVHIEKISQRYNAEAANLTADMFLRGDVDYAAIEAEVLQEWRSDAEKSEMVAPTRVTGDYSYFYTFNFEPQFDDAYEPDNWVIAVNNENFRKSIFHGLDRLKSMRVIYPENAEVLIQNGVTPSGFAVSDSGKDYTSYGDLKAIWDVDSFNETLAKQYRDAAKAELAAAGATFPIKILFPYNSSMETWGQENVIIEQQLEALLGADFIDIIVDAGTSQSFLSAVRRSGKYALLKCNWGADYADPETWTDPFAFENSYNFAYDSTVKLEMNRKTDETMAIIDEYYSLVDAAKAEYFDTDARFEAFAKAEAYYINHAMIIPYGITGGSYQASKLNSFEGQYAVFGQSSSRYKGQWVYETSMSTDMFNAQLADWQAVLGID